MIGYVVLCLTVGFVIGACSLLYSLTVLTDFDVINGPITIISESQYHSHDRHALRDVAVRVVMRRREKEMVVYFKAPIIFQSMNRGDKKYLVKRCMRLADIRPGKITAIEAMA